MKKNTLVIVIVTAVFTAIVSFIVSNAVLGGPQKHPIKVPVVDKISSDFPNPQTDTVYKTFFNSSAVNPTQLIQIGNSQNAQPFVGQ
jgi:energy-converting hydrogenase Eha subunit A